MKLLSALLLNVFLFTSCGCLNNSKSAELATNIDPIKTEPQEQILSFEYEASARGSYQQILITKSKVLKTTKRGGNLTGVASDIEDWNKLIELLETIHLEAIPKLEAPSKDFQFDGAAISRLKIVSNEKTYETHSFDHGNPPKEIVELVKEILSISENIE
jgi:hypothetical protein